MHIPEGAELESKGIAMALADGISSSDVAHIASEAAVKSFVTAAISDNTDDLDAAARTIVKAPFDQGSDDNLTVQILRADQFPKPKLHELQKHSAELPFPPTLGARSLIDGFEIVRELHRSSRSYVYLALDTTTGRSVVFKVPASDVREDPVDLEQFLAEEWIARRIDSPYGLQACERSHPQNYLYVVTEYIGVTHEPA